MKLASEAKYLLQYVAEEDEWEWKQYEKKNPQEE